MKMILLCLLLSGQAIGQTHTDRYIQLAATVDWYGDPMWIKQGWYPKDPSGRTDTLINAAKIDSLMGAAGRKLPPITVLNLLAAEGWELISTAFVPGDETRNLLGDKGRLYYFLKKSFPEKAGLQTRTSQ